MGETVDLEILAGRRHIIERPRLTRLLDATSARVIMLVAPAGYGKTTLARQWLANRPHAWYQAKPASGDVAGLAVGLAESLAKLTPSATRRLGERLRATRDVSQEISILAQIQADAIREWPNGAWLAIDDYQFLASSRDAESYVDALLNSTPVQLLITSRTRPYWATSRRLLYGDFYELGRAPLAMDEEEARSVLAKPRRHTMPGLVALAGGWPAVIGLAALTDGDQLADVLPETLYEFLADELYRAASRPLQKALAALALGPPITKNLLDFLFGSQKGASLLGEASRLGFLTTTPMGSDLHPLLRTFLLRKLAEGDREEAALAARTIASFLLSHDRWDDIFDLFRRYPLADVLITLIENANSEMLRVGRLSTLSEWLDAAAELKLQEPVLNVVRAEVSLRQGNISRAEALSLQMARRRHVSENLRSRAFRVAGQAAHLDNREAEALVHYEQALELAQDRDSRRSATWGKLLCFRAYERAQEVQETLAQFLREEPRDADELLQSVNAQLMIAVNDGGLAGALESALGVKGALSDAGDPLVRTAFLNTLSRSLSLLASYSEALEFADELIAEAEKARLTFVLPHAYVAKAAAQLGLREFGRAESMIAEARRLAQEIGDVHNLVEVQTLLSKLAISTGDFERAIQATADTRWNPRLTPEMLAEYKATRALAFACSSQIADARAGADEAAALTTLPEVATIVACVNAVAHIREEGSTHDQHTTVQSLVPIFDYSLFDPLVVAYRGCPDLLRVAASSKDQRDIMLKILRQAHDASLAKSVGFAIRTMGSNATLSPREAEVLDLLGLGYTNREIASALYIAETTVKVHVRRILQKLGVRSRTEAALIALKER